MSPDVSERPARYHDLAQPPLAELKRRSVRGGFVTLLAQVAMFVIQTSTTMVLARLLLPQDFGLQGMVVAATGFLALFQDAGLGMATVQRLEVTHEQTSTLFWINVAVGAILATLCAALAPLLVAFYHEPRLYWMAVVSGATFLFNGLSAQHGALLRRGMRFVTQAKIGVLSLVVSSGTGIVMALLGCRYWSLVGMALAGSIVNAAGVWLTVPWIPGPPRRRCGVLSMLHFGGVATCNSFVVFLAWNTEKLLLGRYWGADALGLYGRAYQLVTLPVQQLNGAVTGVAFPALSRVQHDAERLKRSFPPGLLFAHLHDHSDHHHLRPVCGGNSPHCAGRQMDGGGTNLQIACPGSVGFCSCQPALLVGPGDGPGREVLEYQSGDNATGNLGNCAGSKPRPQRSRPRILIGDESFDHPDRGLVQTRHRNHLGGSMECQQITFSVRFAGRCRWLAREAHARWQVDANPMSLAGIRSCLRHLRLGAFDSP